MSFAYIFSPSILDDSHTWVTFLYSVCRLLSTVNDASHAVARVLYLRQNLPHCTLCFPFVAFNTTVSNHVSIYPFSPLDTKVDP